MHAVQRCTEMPALKDSENLGQNSKTHSCSWHLNFTDSEAGAAVTPLCYFSDIFTYHVSITSAEVRSAEQVFVSTVALV